MAKATPAENISQANNDTPLEEVNGRPVVTHDDFLDIKIDEAVSAKIKLMNINKLELGCSVTDKKIIAGKEKLDKDKNPTGQFWDDSYSVDISFEGGKFSVRVDAPTFHLLQADGTRYLAKGSVETKVNEYGFSVPSVKVISFERLF